MRRLAVVIAVVGLLVPVYQVTMAPGCESPSALWGVVEGYDDGPPPPGFDAGDRCEEWDRYRLYGAGLSMIVSWSVAAVVGAFSGPEERRQRRP